MRDNPRMDTTRRLMTDAEAGDILGLTPRQVLRMASRRELPSVRLPNREIRFDPDDIARWITSRKITALAASAAPPPPEGPRQ